MPQIVYARNRATIKYTSAYPHVTYGTLTSEHAGALRAVERGNCATHDTNEACLEVSSYGPPTTTSGEERGQQYVDGIYRTPVFAKLTKRD